jgi:hypothetical protein
MRSFKNRIQGFKGETIKDRIRVRSKKYLKSKIQKA